ncbi:cache domain-containing protein [Aquabacterium sp. A7-Y]|uniref:cache domain-containing protein n=1 Tax=Aquabacterium sp. A7-Y TaxID=1349605 RepID=UPI00223E315F|nr:cache domain-containing protein [Aquabacterium sp. A7-Y]MCW7542047.1 cache domain-containing protein [Aquabacterium sp. A7-Y]
MKTTVLQFSAGLAAAAILAGAALAGDRGTKPEAIALAKKAAAFHASQGQDKAYAEINNKAGQFVDRDMYVFVLSDKGFVTAHGANTNLVGKPLINLKDADGKLFAQELVAVIKSGKPGWVDYKWPNPTTKQIEAKTTYVEPAGEIGFAVGIYK